MAVDYILELKDLKTYFYTPFGVARAVDGISFDLQAGKILGLVGESGSGKSVTAMSIMRLIHYPPGKIVNGEIMFKNKDLVRLPKREMMKIRGNEIAMIFQEPMTSLNPVLTIGEQIAENLTNHKHMTKKEAYKKAEEMLDLVKIPRPELRVKEYPHQLSGGMRQRVMIAMALSCKPQLLIADEPTTALDVTIQAQILDLLREIRDKLNTSIILITHDMGVIAEITDYVAVMYCGKIVEYGDTQSILSVPKHPYTSALIDAIPKLGEEREILETIPGCIPSIYRLPKGCRFEPRCKYSKPICKEKEPGSQSVGNSVVYCWH